ncbi:FFLEELY motif protein [Salinisphaera sp. RV14]|uniref:FFLEELY motif protein n=1 Tax=unclassified Salinisphaera TaxID=2649847 RepID=UPI003F861119
MSAAPRPLGEALAALRDARGAIAKRRDPLFHQRLAELRHWQSDRVAAFHAERVAAYDGDALLEFLTRRFYRDADWSELIGRPEKVARAVDRIVDRDRPLVITIELQAAAESLDTAMTDALLADNASLNPHSYVRALRRVGRRDDRLQQILWLEELVDLVADYADNRAAWWAFKLARAPARTFGLGRTYDLLAEGYAAMRATTDLKAGTREVIAAQRARLERLMGYELVD